MLWPIQTNRRYKTVVSRRIASGGVNWALYSHVVLTYGLMLVSTELIPFTVQQRHRDNGEQADGGGGAKTQLVQNDTVRLHSFSFKIARNLAELDGWLVFHAQRFATAARGL